MNNKPVRFAAIDFETANYSPSSACAVGIVIAQGSRILSRDHFLIRPPSRRFVFTDLHGLAWKDVRHAPTFGELFPAVEEKLADVDFLAAHNASFDSRVLAACYDTYGLDQPDTQFVCTVRLARRVLGIKPANLANVCRRLRIALNHHQADSDAEACARIVLRAKKMGWLYHAIG
jgi:DNA polymerase-3 subunit epsilon